MYNFDFNKNEYNNIIDNCNFSKEELKVLELRRKGYTNVAIAMQIDYSTRTVSRLAKKINNKIYKYLKALK